MGNIKRESVPRTSVCWHRETVEDWGLQRIASHQKAFNWGPCSLFPAWQPFLLLRAAHAQHHLQECFCFGRESTQSCQMLPPSPLPNALKSPRERASQRRNLILAPAPLTRRHVGPLRGQWLSCGITRCHIDVGDHSHVQKASGNTSCQSFWSA